MWYRKYGTPGKAAEHDKTKHATLGEAIVNIDPLNFRRSPKKPIRKREISRAQL
jgi:hypothetical protein